MATNDAWVGYQIKNARDGRMCCRQCDHLCLMLKILNIVVFVSIEEYLAPNKQCIVFLTWQFSDSIRKFVFYTFHIVPPSKSTV